MNTNKNKLLVRSNKNPGLRFLDVLEGSILILALFLLFVFFIFGIFVPIIKGTLSYSSGNINFHDKNSSGLEIPIISMLGLFFFVPIFFVIYWDSYLTFKTATNRINYFEIFRDKFVLFDKTHKEVIFFSDINSVRLIKINMYGKTGSVLKEYCYIRLKNKDYLLRLEEKHVEEFNNFDLEKILKNFGFKEYKKIGLNLFIITLKRLEYKF